MSSKGKVYLVGAGPGDPELITVKGARLLSIADAIVYDRLIDKRLLEFARSDALLIYVGKSPGKHSTSQEEINRLLLRLAGEFKVVVRLKGGDPLTFGRGEEECLFLLENGIECEVVPGVTSYHGAASQYLIPLAGRGFSSSFIVATGVRAGGSLLGGEDIARFMTGADTVVFLMSTRIFNKIIEIAKEVRGPSTPIAIVEKATMQDSKMRIGRVCNFLSNDYTPSNPAVIMLGGGPEWRLEKIGAQFFS
jgi:uroporphyrin-III C-methyltransferase